MQVDRTARRFSSFFVTAAAEMTGDDAMRCGGMRLVVSESGQHGAVGRQAGATAAAAAPVQRHLHLRTLLRRPDAVLRRSLPPRRRRRRRRSGGPRAVDPVHRRPASEQGPRRRLVRDTLLDVEQTRTVRAPRVPSCDVARRLVQRTHPSWPNVFVERRERERRYAPQPRYCAIRCSCGCT